MLDRDVAGLAQRQGAADVGGDAFGSIVMG
jgi:hypothetical protein